MMEDSVTNIENKLEYFTEEMVLETDFMVKTDFIRQIRSVLSLKVLTTRFQCHHVHYLVPRFDSIIFVANVHLSKPIGDTRG